MVLLCENLLCSLKITFLICKNLESKTQETFWFTKWCTGLSTSSNQCLAFVTRNHNMSTLLVKSMR